MRRVLLMLAAVAGAVAFSASPVLAADGGNVIYDSTVRPLPGNLPSVGAEAYAFTELGDQVAFAPGARQLRTVTVTLSSWGCQAGHWYSGDCVTSPGARFAIPVTFNIYAVGLNNTAGVLLATRTQTFKVPFRPSSDNANCTGGRWLGPARHCFNGKAANITFNFGAQNVQLPNEVVYGITYDTSHYGHTPIGQSPLCYTSSAGCPYDSLNIALAATVTVGSKPFPDTLYQNAVTPSVYCDNGTAGFNVLRLDSAANPCWVAEIPAVRFVAGDGDGGDNNNDGDNTGGNNQGDNSGGA